MSEPAPAAPQPQPSPPPAPEPEGGISALHLLGGFVVVVVLLGGALQLYKSSRTSHVSRKGTSAAPSPQPPTPGKTPAGGPAPVVAAPAGGDSPRARSHAICLLAIARLAEDRDLVAAKKAFQQAADTDPTDPEPRFDLGVVAERSERWEEAIQAYEECRKLDATSESSVKAQLKIDYLKKLVEQDKTPEGRKARRYDQAIARARIRLERRELAEAAGDAAAAAKIDEGRFEAHCIAASALMKMDAHDEALAFLKQALERAPEKQKSAIRTSIAECERIVEGEAKAAVGAAALDAGEYLKAGAAFQKAWQLRPEREDLGLSASVALALGENYAESAKILQKLATSSDPSVVTEAKERLSRIGPMVEGGRKAPPPRARPREGPAPAPEPPMAETPARRPAEGPARPREVSGPCGPCRAKAADCRSQAREQRANADKLRSGAAAARGGDGAPEQASLYEAAAVAYEDAARKYEACAARPCDPCRGAPDSCR